jgi:PIN domain nuclease of toxin-antitoxin system
MKLMLDSNMIILAAKDELPSACKQLIEHRGNKLYYSVAAIWEMTIKYASGKLKLPVSPQVIERGLIQAGYTAVDITSKHVRQLGSLREIHKDPFDRIMIAQTLVEGLDFLTCDAMLPRYSDQVIYYSR